MAHELKSLFDKLTFLGEPYNSFIEIEAEPSYLMFVTGDVFCLWTKYFIVKTRIILLLLMFWLETTNVQEKDDHFKVPWLSEFLIN